MSDAPVNLNGHAIRAVILDFGEVLSYPPPAQTIAAMADLMKVAPGKFREYYYAGRHAYDCGELSAEDYWTAVAKDAGARLSPEQVDWLRRTDVAMWSNTNPLMLRWAGQLQARGFRTAVLSNMHEDMARGVRTDFAWVADFHCIALSAELGFAKPDPQIYEHCLTCLKVEANEALFIDDKERNTRGAEALGIAAICANTPESIRAKLQAAGWSGPLP